MRSIVLAAVMVAGLGLAGTTAATAAPVSGTGIDQAVQHDSNVTKVQHWRWHSRGYRRCHYRRWSRWGRC